MLKIDDEGKIWIRGTEAPEHGIRVGELYFTTGKKNEEQITYHIDNSHLLVDLNNPTGKYRIILRYRLDLEPITYGTLFNGFKMTKHADIKTVTHRDIGVEKFYLKGEDYSVTEISSMDTARLMKMTDWE